MDAQTIANLIRSGMQCHSVDVHGDDGRHWRAHVVSDAFVGKRPVARHQMVYATLGNKMQTDEIHALSILAQTVQETQG